MDLEPFLSVSAVVVICSITLSIFCYYKTNTSLVLSDRYLFSQTSFMMTLITGVILLLQAYFFILSLFQVEKKVHTSALTNRDNQQAQDEKAKHKSKGKKQSVVKFISLSVISLCFLIWYNVIDRLPRCLYEIKENHYEYLYSTASINNWCSLSMHSCIIWLLVIALRLSQRPSTTHPRSNDFYAALTYMCYVFAIISHTVFSLG